MVRAVPMHTAAVILAIALPTSTIEVPGDFPTIQEAIEAASDGDTIEIAAGTYHEHDLSLQQKAITLRGSTGPDGMPLTTIDSLGLGDNVMAFFGEGNDTVVEHLVFTGVAGGDWAAVTMFHARPTMINCTFVGNETTGIGGGVYNLNGAPIFIDCRFIDNTANWGGGYACWETGQPDHPSFLRCTFSGNSAVLGGGFANLRSSPTLVECFFEHNTATEDGGAILNEGDPCCERWFGDVLVDSCVFDGNTAAGSGGAICNRTFGTSTIVGCTIRNNAAGLAGSAVASSDPTMAILTGSTVCSNLGTFEQIEGPADLDGSNSIRDECPVTCSGDVNGDGSVDVTDLLAVIAGWDEPYDVGDLLTIIGGWGTCR